MKNINCTPKKVKLVCSTNTVKKKNPYLLQHCHLVTMATPYLNNKKQNVSHTFTLTTLGVPIIKIAQKLWKLPHKTFINCRYHSNALSNIHEKCVLHTLTSRTLRVPISSILLKNCESSSLYKITIFLVHNIHEKMCLAHPYLKNIKCTKFHKNCPKTVKVVRSSNFLQWTWPPDRTLIPM